MERARSLTWGAIEIRYPFFAKIFRQKNFCAHIPNRIWTVQSRSLNILMPDVCTYSLTGAFDIFKTHWVILALISQQFDIFKRNSMIRFSYNDF